MLIQKKSDPFFIAIFSIALFCYIVLVYFNTLRFYSLNPLLIGFVSFERAFRFVVFGGGAYNFPYGSPWQGFSVMPLTLFASYFFYCIFWLLNNLFNIHITLSQLLLIFQPLIFVSTAIVLYKLANFIIGNRWLAFAVSFSYLTNQLVFIGSSMGFLFTCIGLPLLVCEFYFISRHKLIKALIFILLVNMTRADLILANIIVGTLLLFKSEFRKYGWCILAISIPWFVMLGIFVVPKVNLEIFHSSQYGKYLNEAVSYLVLRPLDILHAVFNFFYATLPVYISHSFFLPLFCPIFLLPMISSIPVLIFKNDTSCIFTNLAFVYLSVILGIKFLIYHENNNWFKNALGALLIFSSCMSHYFTHFTFIDSSVGVIPFSSGFSIKENFPSERNKLGLKIIQSIPQNSSCFTIKPLAERLGYLKTLGIFGITRFDDYVWDYCLFSTQNLDFAGWKFDYDSYFMTIRKILESKEYSVKNYEEGWLLLEKVKDNSVNMKSIDKVIEEITILEQRFKR